MFSYSRNRNEQRIEISFILLVKQRCNNRAEKGGDKRRACWIENNSQLLRREMPWLQIDQSINSVIIHFRLIGSVSGPSMLSH